jgi:hypothetical protein
VQVSFACFTRGSFSSPSLIQFESTYGAAHIRGIVVREENTWRPYYTRLSSDTRGQVRTVLPERGQYGSTRSDANTSYLSYYILISAASCRVKEINFRCLPVRTSLPEEVVLVIAGNRHLLGPAISSKIILESSDP